MSVLKEFHTKIVGTSHKNDEDEPIQKLLEDMSDYVYEGLPLVLEHEGDNKYDENAIKVYCDGNHIGYLNRELAKEIVDAVDEDRVEATVAQITGGDGLSFGCNIHIKIHNIPIDHTTISHSPKISFSEDLLQAARTYITTIPTLSSPLVLQKEFGLRYSEAEALVDRLEEIGDLGPIQRGHSRPVYTYDPQNVKTPLIQRIFKPVIITCLIICVVCYGAIFAIRHQEKKAAAWDRHAIATATVALDQYAPGIDYGPIQTTGWTVIHNADGTTTVWAPRIYGQIAVMFTDDGENYTPYYISVNGNVMLGK